MDDKTGKKPLRHSMHKSKDLIDTYMKNTERNIPIQGADSEEKAENELHYDKNAENSEYSPEMEEIYLLQIAELNEKVTALEKERNEFKEQAIRLAAELDNFRRRTQKEKNDMMDYANEKLLFQMLELVDNLSSAVTAGKQAVDTSSMLTGLDMIYQKTLKMFSDAGVSLMEDPVGKPFDVHLQEALMVMPSEFEEGTVVQVVQPGYMIKDRVLRHAKVITSAGEPATT
jgi:molecular chaperone GrpE